MTIKFRPQLKNPKRILVKIGSNVLANSDLSLDLNKIKIIVEDLAYLSSNTIEIILVSSGAILAGKKFLNTSKKSAIDYLQAASAIGQPKLMNAYSNYFKNYNLNTAQILLTHDDFNNRQRFLNAKNTLTTLLKNNIIPILNENDTISYNEITVGDNDQLATMVAQMLDVDVILLISSTDGVYSKPPNDFAAEKISFVAFNNNLDFVDTNDITPTGRGGMESKLIAVKKASSLGLPCIIAGKDYEKPIIRALTENVGTYFEAKKLLESINRKSWLMSIVKPSNFLVVDSGCCDALVKKNSSLLPSGIVEVSGNFKRGDCIYIVYNNKIIAVGLCEYESKEIKKIMGKKSCDINSSLGYFISEEIVHKDNLSLI